MRVVLSVLFLFVSSACPSLRIDSKDSLKQKNYFGTDANHKRINSLDSVEIFNKNGEKGSKLGSARPPVVRTLLSEMQRRLKANHLRRKLQKDLDGENAKLKIVPKRRSSRSRTYNTDRIMRDSSSDTISSSSEVKNWKEEWKEVWMKKKMEALNATTPRGDVVNMVAARPWGVPCGDPNLHDMPWGTCMLAMECEAEFRIYRGDYFCGATQFVCCAIQLQTYDMNVGFDLSFDDSAFETDSEERKNRDQSSREKKRKRRKKDRVKRKRRRTKRKRRIKRTIKLIIKRMRKLLNRHYRNRTRVVKRKTKELKKFVKLLKKKYKKDREAVKDVHEIELIKIDAALHDKFEEMRKDDKKILLNSTLSGILSNGTISKTLLRQLAVAYPEIMPYAKLDETRRAFNRKRKDYLDYDIEYGYMYY